MKTLLHWFDQRTGLDTSLGNWFQRPIAGGPAWRFVWPTTIAFALFVQAITGLVLWMYYSAGAQSSWESVYYLQYHVLGGWLLRAIHFYMGQATLVLVGMYLVQMIFRGAYRPPREFLFWTVLLMGLATLGLNLTGDLLPWDQNSLWATTIRVAYLSHLPAIGPWLSKLAIGGPQFGTLAITRFLALHVGACTAAFLTLVLLHARLAARHGLEESLPSPSGREAGGAGRRERTVPYWPQQAWRDAAACCLVMAVVVGLSARHGVSGPQAGIELGAPADTVNDPGTARPEWSFRGLYQLHETLSRWPEIISIFAIPGLTVLVFFAMPWIGCNLAGRALNIALTLLVLGGLGVLTWRSYVHDAKDDAYQDALKASQQQAERVKELAVQPSPEEIQKAEESGETPPYISRIPFSGALTLLHPKTKPTGPRLFNQHCASCHDYSGPDSGIARPEKPTAADLYQFASRAWLTDFMTAKGFASPKYFGKTKFTPRTRARCMSSSRRPSPISRPRKRSKLSRRFPIRRNCLSQRDADFGDLANILAGNKLIKENCSECHAFHSQSKGTGTKGPDLTWYGSRDWLIAIIANPAHKRFYGEQNDRMPAYADHEYMAPATTDAKQNLLSRQELELLADWLRGE